MKAKRISEKAGIGIFSSSSPISATVPERYFRGAKYLEEKGFRIIHGSLCGKRDFYRAGSIAERAEEFNALLYDERVDILMASIGGFNTNSILPYIDYEYIKKQRRGRCFCVDIKVSFCVVLLRFLAKDMQEQYQIPFCIQLRPLY